MVRQNWAALTFHVMKLKVPEGARSLIFMDQWDTCSFLRQSLQCDQVWRLGHAAEFTQSLELWQMDIFFFFSRCTLEKERKSKKGKQKKNLSTGTLKRFHNFSSVVLSAWFYLQVSRNRKWVPSYLLQELQEIFPVTFFQRFAVAKAPTLFILWETIIINVLDSCDWIIDISVPHSWLFRCQ